MQGTHIQKYGIEKGRRWNWSRIEAAYGTSEHRTCWYEPGKEAGTLFDSKILKLIQKFCSAVNEWRCMLSLIGDPTFLFDSTRAFPGGVDLRFMGMGEK